MENRVRDLLRGIAEDIPPQGEIPHTLRARARRRIATTVGVTLVTVAGLVLVGVVAVRSSTTSPVPATPAPTTEPPGAFAQVRGWITYRSGGQILAVDPADPSDTVVIAEAEVCNQAPHVPRTCGIPDPVGWSRDGTKLLASGPLGSDGSGALFVLGADGSATRIVRGGPTWGSLSPDGTRLTYSLGGGEPGPVIEDVAGGEPRALVPGCRGCGENVPESAVAWSPDGSRIAWIDFWEHSAKCPAPHAYSLSFVDPDGTGLREQVTCLPEWHPAWSLVWAPDGARLAFWEYVSKYNGATPDDPLPGQIFVINADGSGLRQITDTGDNRWPAWSPDGSRIAFVHDGELFTMAPDGTDMQSVSGIHPDGPIAWNWA